MRGPVVGSRSALTTLERIGREDRELLSNLVYGGQAAFLSD